MNQEEFNMLVEQVGKQATEKIASEMKKYKEANDAATKAMQENKGLTADEFKTFKDATESAINEVKEIAAKQGTSLLSLQESVGAKGKKLDILANVMQKDEAEIEQIKKQGFGNKTYMAHIGVDGHIYARPFDETKAVLPFVNQTVGGNIPGGSDTFSASVSQSISGASILRLGADAPIVQRFKNTPFIFDLCNIITAGWDMPIAAWWEQQAIQGSPAIVAEGDSKPRIQYEYKLKTAEYKVAAAMIGFSDQFKLDFAHLYSDIMSQGRTDLVNKINTEILTNILSAATSYSQGSYPGICEPNDFDAIIAMAAMADSATFGGNPLGTMTNAALMSTSKKWSIGSMKNGIADYIKRPEILDNIPFVGNPAVGADDIIVGDFRRYNIMLRGNFIVKVGYNMDDLARNRFSAVLEQYYFDYIPEIHKSAIVKGATFATVKAAIDSGEACPCPCQES